MGEFSVGLNNKSMILAILIIDFKIDQNRKQIFDRSARKFLRKSVLNQKPLNLDLTDGFETFVDKSEKYGRFLGTIINFRLLANK